MFCILKISKRRGDFYCLNCLQFYCLNCQTSLNHIKKVCENKYFCNVIVPSKNTKILEFNQYQKFDKAHLLFTQILSI